MNHAKGQFKLFIKKELRFSTYLHTFVRQSTRAMTLVELLVVMLILTILLGATQSVFISIGKLEGTESAAYNISGTLETARSYAMENNTYTWVGFFEEDANAPRSSGVGKVVLAIVASINGEAVLARQQASVTNSNAPIILLERLKKLENVHLGDVGAPRGSGDHPGTLAERQDFPYTENTGIYRISSSSSIVAPFPFSAGGYSFDKVVMFTPRGEAKTPETSGNSPSTEYTMKPVVEIGLLPTNGTTILSDNADVAAIQFTGIAGNVKIYRP